MISRPDPPVTGAGYTMDVKNNSYKVLIVGPSWVGDMVMAQTLFKLLAAQHAQLQLDVLAPGWAAPVLERMPKSGAACTCRWGMASCSWVRDASWASSCVAKATDRLSSCPIP
jgi:hypothetical protein